MAQPLVKIENASAFYPGLLPRKKILANISWQIERGCHCALFGPNGAGKSSLLKLLHGDLWAASGSIHWLEREHYSDSPIIARKLSGLVAPHIQVVCQQGGWNVKALDLLAGAATDSPLSFTANAEQNSALVSLLAELEATDLAMLHLSELSQGQLRLILLARELSRKPPLLLLDEWSEGLDQKKRKLVLDKLESLASEITMIFASHRHESLPGWIREQRYLDDGRFCELPQRKISTGAIINASSRALASTGRPIFELENVSVYIDSKPALKDITWKMRGGEHWQIHGPNGAGKSTFLRVLAGNECVYAGGIFRFWPRDAELPAQALADKRRAISLVSDLGQALYGYNMTALQLILSGIDNTIGLYREFGKEEIDWASELLAQFFPDNAKAIASQPIRRVSSGQLRRLFLARAIAGRPEVLLLDEPVSNLDQEAEMRCLDMLARLINAGIAGIRPALVAVSHQPLPEFFNREAYMDRGRLEMETRR